MTRFDFDKQPPKEFSIVYHEPTPEDIEASERFWAGFLGAIRQNKPSLFLRLRNWVVARQRRDSVS